MSAFTPIYRPRNFILALLLIILALIGNEVYRALTATPGHAINYTAKVEEIIESNQPKDTTRETPDAWPVLRDLIDRLATVENSLRHDPSNPRGLPVDFSVLMGGAHSSPQYDEDTTWETMESLARRGVATLREDGVLEDLHKLTQMRRAVRILPKGPLIEVLLPEIGKMRQFARINGARMIEASKTGDEREFVRAYEETLALARISALQGFIIEHLVGIAINSLANNQVRQALTERPLSAEGCEEVLAAMNRQLPLTPIAQVMRTENLCVLDIIQWTHTDDGHGDGRILLAAANQLGGGGLYSAAPASGGLFAKWKIFNLASIAFPGKKATIEKANDYFAKLIAYAELSPVERRKSSFSTEQWMEDNLPKRYIILRMCIPAVDKALSSRNCSDVEVEGTRLMLALEIFNARNGRYPEKLEELAPSILPTIPEDPIAGAPFVYRLIKPEEDTLRRTDGSPRPYLLYSRGLDGRDDGGKSYPKNENLALTSQTAKGHDYIFNMPRAHPPPPGAPKDPE